MEILSLFETREKTLIAFIAPFYAGDCIREVTITMQKLDIHDILVHVTTFHNYKAAHREAYLTTMCLDEYNKLYGKA